MVSVRSKKLLIGSALFIIVALVATGVVLIVRNQNDEETKVVTVDKVEEYVTPVNDFVTSSIDEITNEPIQPEEKLQKLLQASYLKISVERYDEALAYQEAAINLGILEGQKLNNTYYEALLVSRKLEAEDKIEYYSNLLGPEKLAEFDTPKNKEDERGE